jgi:RNA polymerase sigma-70 factor (ECF subfamily)
MCQFGRGQGIAGSAGKRRPFGVILVEFRIPCIFDTAGGPGPTACLANPNGGRRIQKKMVAATRRSAVPTQAEFHEAISNRSDRWFSACLRITRNTDLAEDAVQEALLSAWDKRRQFQHGSSLETWIHRIAINAALQLMRKERPDRFAPLDPEMSDEAERPEDDAANRDFEAVLSGAFRHLSDIERVCFVLKHMEQWRLAEISDELDTNVGVVKQSIFRAVRKLRQRMPDIRSV